MPNESLSQLELIYRYRILLDEAMRTPPDKRRTIRGAYARGKILALVQQNPVSTGSKHVMWNIGKARREWLLAFLTQEYPEWNTQDSKKEALPSTG